MRITDPRSPRQRKLPCFGALSAVLLLAGCSSMYAGSQEDWRFGPDAGTSTDGTSRGGSSSGTGGGVGSGATAAPPTGTTSPPSTGDGSKGGSTTGLDGGFLSVGQIPGSASLAYPYIRFDSIAVTSSSLLFTASNMLGTHCVLGRMSKAGGGIAIVRASTDCLMYVATKGNSVYLATNYDRSTKEKSRVELIEPSSSTPSFALTAVARTRLSNISVSDAVYVVADGDYLRVPLQGGVLSRLGWWPSTELVAGQNAFFLGGGRTISGVPVGSTTAQTLVSDRSNVSGIASDGTNLYWTENSEHPQLRDTRIITIYRGSIAGGSIQKVGNVPTPPSASSGMELRLAIDGTTAYAALNTQIYKQPLTF